METKTTTSELEIQIQNLRAFAKLYGCARFFHPSDGASGIDWEQFAVYVAGRALQAAG